MSPIEKLHSACDECRSRKLKCSGGIPMCTRCERERIDCAYSPQKQMGRPKKRRRDDEAPLVDEPAQCPQLQCQHENALEQPITEFVRLGRNSTSVLDLPELDHSSGSTEDGRESTAQQDFVFANNFEDTITSNFNFDLDTIADPILWNIPPQNPLPSLTSELHHPDLGPCNCLTLAYQTLSSLQSLSTFSFPLILPPLRTAMSALSTLLHCPTCPSDPFTATQNIQSITSLFKAIVLRFSKALLDINAEAARLALNNEKKPFRVGDNSPALAHMHTGTLDCPMGFKIDLEAREWKKIAKTALRMEVWGGGSGGAYLVGLLEESEERQRRWHKSSDIRGEEMRHLRREGEDCGEGKSCEALGTEHIRRAIEGLDWE